MSPATCPTRQQLHEFLVGTLPPQDAETIDAHLESCTTCQDSLQGLDNGQDSLISLLRQPAPEDEYAKEPARARLVSAAKGLLVATSAGGHPTILVPSDQTAIAAELGEYELLEKLGEGGMGAVYKARQEKLKRIVAIKLLPKERLADPKAVARFEREMEAVGAVDHPNIVRAMYAGEHEGTPYLAIEYVDGLSLTEVVMCLKALRIADACELMRQAAVGLQHAHEKRLVHRDIKPSNLMLTRDGTVKVLDLGLALLHTPASRGAEMTAAGSMMGTADYVAPEQVTDSHSVDIRADIYSLGCTLYKLLSGQAPFVGLEYKNDITKIMAHVQKTPPPITLLRSDVSPQLAAVIERMMAKDPAQRYATPAEVAAALAPFAVGADLRRLMAEAMQIMTPDASTVTPTSRTEHASGSPVADTATSHPKVSQPDTSSAVPQLQSAPARGWPPRSIGIGLAAVAASFLLIALGAIVIRIRDKDGRETVIQAPPGSTVTLEENGKQVAQIPAPDEGTKPAPEQPAAKPLTIGKPIERPKPATLNLTPEPLEIKPGEPLSKLALIPNPPTLKDVRSWTLETVGVRGSVNSLDYSPDGQCLAGGTSEGTIRLWDPTSGKLLRVIVAHDAEVTSVAWSPDGRYLASASADKTVRLWSPYNGSHLRTLEGHAQAVTSISWSPDGE